MGGLAKLDVSVQTRTPEPELSLYLGLLFYCKLKQHNGRHMDASR